MAGIPATKKGIPSDFMGLQYSMSYRKYFKKSCGTIMPKKIQNTIYTAVIFFVVTMPFRKLFHVMEITEMRPVSALPPVFGLTLGFPGILGCALGNLAADFVSGYDPLLCALGFVAQLIYGALPLFMWIAIKRHDAGEASVLRLNNVKNVIRYMAIVFTNAVVMAALLGAIMQGFNISPLFSTATLMLFLNNFVFCMVLGIPLLVFMTNQKSPDRRDTFSLNERLVLFFLILGLFSAGLNGIFAYRELSKVITDPLVMWNRTYFYISANLFIFYLITVAFLRYAEKNITVPVESIAAIAKNYISGAHGKKDSQSIVTVCGRFSGNRNETGVLAKAFTTMVLDLDTYIDNLTKATAEKERIAVELTVATQIQTSMLPCVFSPFPGRKEFDIYATMIPAKEVGGDFYDFFFIDDNKLAVVIADVSGKGIPAALFMVIAKTLIKNNALSGMSPKEVFESVNSMLCENNDAGMFVTAFMGYVNLQNGRFRYVNAGHDYPLIKRAGGEYKFLKTTSSFVLAGMDGTVYMEDEITLASGDMLYLYTDGVTEAANANNELFSKPRLIETINKHKSSSIKELLELIKNDIDAFANGEEQADDITMLALRMLGNGETPYLSEGWHS